MSKSSTSKPAAKKAANKMKDIYIEKLVINCNVGESGDKLTKAARVVTQLTGQEPIFGRGMNVCKDIIKNKWVIKIIIYY